MDLDYGLFDADNHYYEQRDCFTRYIEPRFAERAIRPVVEDGRERLLVGDRPFTFLDQPFRDYATRPGGLREMLRNLSTTAWEDNPAVEPVQPAYLQRDARLGVMDAQGLESILVLPTLAVCVEHFMKDDVEQTYANLHAFNRWLDDEWGFDHRGRIYAPPLMSLLDVDRAVAELDWVLARGARVVHLRPGPVAGRAPSDPHFDGFWARVDEARVAVAFHISESGYNELFSSAWGQEPNPSSHRQSAFQWTSFYGDRPIMDTIAALIYDDLFGTFPNVRVASLENGSLWVPYLLKVMDKMNGMGRNGPWARGRLTERPSDVFRRHVYVSPYHEEDVRALVELIGAERVLFGSDFPHAEGLAEPRRFVDLLAGADNEDVRRVMRDNARELVGVA